MNDQLQAFARQTIKDGLDKFRPEQLILFRLIYARDDEASVEEAVAVPIHQVVDEIPVDQLDQVMRQVEISLARVVRLAQIERGFF